jgi:hypothetical protein
LHSTKNKCQNNHSPKAKTHYELDQLSETQKLELHLFTTIALLVTQAKPSVCVKQVMAGNK